MRRAALAGVVLALVLPEPALAAEQRFAGPGSMKVAGTCPQADPCKLKWAVDGAVNGDEIIVMSGDHTVNAEILVNKVVNMHGIDGQPRPRLVVAAPAQRALAITAAGVTVRHLQIDSAGASGTMLMNQAAVLSDLILNATGDATRTFEAFRVPGQLLMRDTVVRFAGASGSAAAVIGGSPDVQMRNVTVVASSTATDAIRVSGFCFMSMGSCLVGTSAPGMLTAKNVIARGTRLDLVATQDETEAGTIHVSYSSFDPNQVQENFGVVSDDGNNQSAPPLFVDPANGDFRQLLGSPTIDAGTVDGLTGPTDPEGDPRVLGAAPDIGADEFVPPAPPGPDSTNPVLSQVTVIPAAFPAERRGPLSVTAARGATVSYSLDEAATVAFRVQRRAAGRRVGRRCVKPTRRNRKRRRCTRWVTTRGSFSRPSSVGVNRFHFTGWVGGHKLRRGRYRLVAVATDAAGNGTRPVRARFRIVRRR